MDTTFRTFDYVRGLQSLQSELRERPHGILGQPHGKPSGAWFSLIAPALVGVALFGFTLSYDELARSSQALGAVNTLPLELRGLTTTVTNPSIYALGAVTTGVSFLVIGLSLGLFWVLRQKAGNIK